MFKLFDNIIEIIGWLRIVASPFFAGIITGSIIYYYKQDLTGIIIGIAFALAGILIGIIWATRIFKRNSTNDFLSQIAATPDLQKEIKKAK